VEERRTWSAGAGKRGHISNECWQKDQEMEAYRASKGKGKGKDSWGKGGGWKGQSKGQGGKSKGKGKSNNWHGNGNGYGGAGKGGGTGAYWFDQPHQGQGGDDRTWAFSLSDGFEIPKKTAAIARPPGLSPPILSPTTWTLFRKAESEADYSEENCMTAEDITVTLRKKEKPKKMMQAKFQTKSQIKKKNHEDNREMNKATREYVQQKELEEKQRALKPWIAEMMEASNKLIQKERENVMCLIDNENLTPEKESVNMLKGWCREEAGWTRVRSVMDSGCGRSVAPPGMCPTYPIMESEGSKRGQEFVSASEDTIPNLGEQLLVVELDGGDESLLKYQIADVSRALNSITEICDGGHVDYGHHVVFGLRGGMIVNLETGKQTPFEREKNIYCLDYWAKPFTRQGS
jgi:hypothetical protein